MNQIKAFQLFSLLIFLFFLFSCSKKEEIIEINVFLSEPITTKNDKQAPSSIVSFLEPTTCVDGNLAIRPKVQVHRLDINGVPNQELMFPLSKGGEFREKINFLSFKHYNKEFNENSKSTPNIGILHREGNQEVDFSAISYEPGQTYLCCYPNAKEDNQFESLEAVLAAVKDSLCNPEYAASSVDIFMVNQKRESDFPVTLEVPEPSKGSGTSTSLGLDLSSIFNEIGNADLPPQDRMEAIPNYLDVFSADADVKILGNSSGKIMELVPAEKYLERIALYKSLNRIEIDTVLLDDSSKVWEVRLYEYHN